MKTISNDRILIATQMKDMKEEIIKIESENIIEEAINLAESRLKEQSTINKKEEVLEKHKNSTIKNYLTSIKGKSVKEIIKDFENKINEYNKGVEVIIEKIKVEKKQLEDECKSLIISVGFSVGNSFIKSSNNFLFFSNIINLVCNFDI